MTSREIRGSFLKYFERQGHRIVASSPLVPQDDPTLLFTNAGMNQFKDVFLGRERREYHRATTSQKCMRVSGKHNDLENVGPSLRHHTFFEMLGNFSFGDYFKEGAIAYAWELLTEVWGLPADRLFATVFRGESGIPRDDDAYRLWQRFVPVERIAEMGLGDNFWSMGDTGPCGRCSEIHYFRGNQYPCTEPTCLGLECSCDRYIEIWNNVFMEFDRQVDGALTPLPAPSIDTGMGLERITAILQDKLSNYDTDLFTPILRRIGDLTGVTYGPLMAPATVAAGDVSMRVVADHIRAMTFLIGDGVVPSNEWRGYVLRKIMRRAMRHGKHLGMTGPFLHRLVEVLAAEMGDAFPELRTNRDTIERTILAEENRFDAVLIGGLPRLEADLAAVHQAGGRVLPGEQAFRLYDTFGVPLDFIEDIATSQGVTVDRAGYDRAMEAQRGKARAKSAFDGKKIDELTFSSDDTRDLLRAAGDQFDGYTTTRLTGVEILAVFDTDRRQVDALAEGDQGFVALERTPFYLEAGGQVSDTGSIYNEADLGQARVDDVVRGGSGLPRLHAVNVTAGRLQPCDLVTAAVNHDVRNATRRNHTATHLLHAALRSALGPHVKQAGSLVAPDRLRFDFVHFAALTRDELSQIERLVNEEIWKNIPVDTDVRRTEEAIAAGAMALFGEKYGDRVRVVSIEGFSLELCGGTHVRATGDIGFFTILQEGGVAAGVRRIEAVTGAGALERHQSDRAYLDGLREKLNVPVDQLAAAVERLQSDVKRLSREVGQLKVRAAMGTPSAEATGEHTVLEGGVTLAARRIDGLEKDALREFADALKSRIERGVIVLAGEDHGKVAILVSVTKDLTKRVHAGNLVKQLAPIVGGGGGGRPDFAEAGGKDASRIDELLAQARRLVGEALGA